MSDQKQPKAVLRKPSSAPPPIEPIKGGRIRWVPEPPRANHVIHKIALLTEARWISVEEFAGMVAAAIHPVAAGAPSPSGSVTLEGEAVPLMNSPALNSGILRATCEEEYVNRIEAAIKDGHLQALDPATHLPHGAGAIHGRQLKNSVIAVAELQRWAEDLGIGIELEKAQPVAGQSTLWPWGGHDTKLLGHLRAAAEKFWKNYDRAQPDTAPTNEKVKAWLEDRGVSDRVAAVMATILRADNLPDGRPKSRR